jgi:hypothetical protein
MIFVYAHLNFEGKEIHAKYYGKNKYLIEGEYSNYEVLKEKKSPCGGIDYSGNAYEVECEKEEDNRYQILFNYLNERKYGLGVLALIYLMMVGFTIFNFFKKRRFEKQ